MRDQAFRFRLERVRWLRQQTERSVQEDLAASLGRESDGERSLREIDATISSAQESERTATGAGASGQLRSGEELLAVDAYLERLAGSRAAAAHELDRRRTQVEDDRRRLIAAARERQALDRLRGRRLSEHQREQARREGAELDELALAAHRRGRSAA